MPTTFVDQSGPTPGTALSAANLNGLVQGLSTANLAAAAGIVAGQIASVNGAALVHGIRQVVCYQPASDVWVGTIGNAPGGTTYANYGHLVDVAITTTSGSSLLALLVCSPFNWLGSANNWCVPALALDGGNNVFTANKVTSAAAGPIDFNQTVAVLGLWTGVSAAAHTVNLLMQAGGPGGTTQSAGFKATPPAASNSYCSVLVLEWA